jgi:hypothetical protein
LTPASADPSQLSILQPREIPYVFDKALKNTMRWQFKGGFGRYFRSHVIPTLSKRASSEHVSIRLDGFILDPRKTELCELIARHRNSIKNYDNTENWNAAKAREQLCATLLVALLYKSKNSLLDLSLYFTPWFVPSRVDLSDECVVVTREDRTAPAIVLLKDTYFYNSHIHELSVARDQCERVTLLTLHSPLRALSEAEARSALLTLVGTEVVDSIDVAAVCGIVNTNDNPYD